MDSRLLGEGREIEQELVDTWRRDAMRGYLFGTGQDCFIFEIECWRRDELEMPLGDET